MTREEQYERTVERLAAEAHVALLRDAVRVAEQMPGREGGFDLAYENVRDWLFADERWDDVEARDISQVAEEIADEASRQAVYGDGN